MQRFRTTSGGCIDRGQPLRFVFDGKHYQGYAGDTLASALLANGVRLVGRSFKYHRPRGVVAAGADEPNALITLRTGARAEPNLRATQIELFDGLKAKSQNRWPSLQFDVGGATGLMSRLFPAGFYYKTFMWPSSWWMFYERVIRRAAGLGPPTVLPDKDTYAKRFAHCDVLVVGGGPRGLMAALAAGRSGARVMLVDEKLPTFATPKKTLPRRLRKGRLSAEAAVNEAETTKTTDTSSRATNKEKSEEVPVAHTDGSAAMQDSSLKEATAAEQEDMASAEKSDESLPQGSKMDVDMDYTEEMEVSSEPAGTDAVVESPNARSNTQILVQGDVDGNIKVATETERPTEEHCLGPREGRSVASTDLDGSVETEASMGNKGKDPITTRHSAISTEHSETEVDEGEKGPVVEEAFNAQRSAQMEVQHVPLGGSKETEIEGHKDLDSGTELNITAENELSNIEDVELESLDDIQLDPKEAETNPSSIPGFPLLTQPSMDDEEGTEGVHDTGFSSADNGGNFGSTRPVSFKCPPLSSRKQPPAPSSPTASVGSLQQNIVKLINDDFSDGDVNSNGFLLTQDF